MYRKMERSTLILKLLINEQGYISSDALCKTLGVSDRTLRDDIAKCKPMFLANGINIRSKHGRGYQVEIIEEQKYYAYIHTLLKKEANAQRLLPVDPEDRIQYLIRYFLTHDDFVKLDDLADEICVSRSTLSNDLKEVRERLSYFHLELESKPAYGSRLQGSEFHKRSCIAQYFFHTASMDDQYFTTTNMSEEQGIIRDLLYQTMIEKDFRLTDIGFQNLIIHLSIALLRIREHKQKEEVPFSYEELIPTREYELACDLVSRIEAQFEVSLPDVEIMYITIHIMGKKNMQYQNNFIINEEIEGLLHEIFHHIQEGYGIDLSHDFELYTLLALHLQPMLNRLRYALPIRNPLLARIKTENSVAFEIAVLAAKVIDEQCKCHVDEAETGYLALHFALAIERLHAQVPQKRILIVCASGAGSSQILLYKVKQRFQRYLAETRVLELYELHQFDQGAYDFILSTIPIPFATLIPVIQVQYFLDGKDIVSVSEAFQEAADTMDFIDAYFQEQLFFTDLKGRNREEILHELCVRTSLYKQLPADFEQSVLEREAFACTEFGNAIALPHPMKPMSAETFVSVAILPKAIRWQKQNVKYVFLICVCKEDSEALGLFHEALSSLVLDEEALTRWEKQPDLKELKRILKNIAKREKENSIDVLFG